MKSRLRTFFIIFMAILFCGMAEVHAQSLWLVLMTDPEPVLGFSETAPVEVRLSGIDGPIEGVAVGFTPLTDTADTYLDQLRDTTNAKGVAATTIMAGSVPIDFDVQISVPADDSVDPLILHVRVASSAGLPEAEYPGDFSSMQEAIDALADGGVLKVAKGRHFIEEPVFIIGKRVVIKGAGSGLRAKKGDKVKRPVTHLIGRPPRPVLDARHNVILPVEKAEGLINAIAADVVVRDIRISGFDAGIVVKDSAERLSGTMTVSNVYIRETGRGIAALSSGDLFVEFSVIKGTLWHGIIKSPPVPVINKVYLHKVLIGDPGGAGAYFNGETYAIISEVDVAGGLRGGVVCYECELYVVNSHIHDNYKAGILLLLAKNTSYISNNLIENNKPDFFTLNFGDGIISVLSDIHVWNNQIVDHPRAGLSNFGGYAALGNNVIQCAGYGLEGEPLYGNPFEFHDASGNYCGCPTAAGSCVAETAGLEPPEPVAPIE